MEPDSSSSPFGCMRQDALRRDSEGGFASNKARDQQLSFQAHVVHQSMTFLKPDATDAYSKAVAMAPDVVEHETPHDLFYKFAKRDVQAAGVRLASYWRLRRDLFEDSYLMPLPLAMKPEEWQVLMHGITFQLPPTRDDDSDNCCSLVFLDRVLQSWVTGSDDDEEVMLPLLQRCIFYQVHMMQLQSSRFDLLMSTEQATGAAVGSCELKLLALVRTLLEECMCIQSVPEAIHLITVDYEGADLLFSHNAERMDASGSADVGEAWVAILSSLSSASWSCGVYSHCGSPASIRQSLEQQGGFAPYQLPVTVGGTWTVDEQWQPLLSSHFNSQYASQPYYSDSTPAYLPSAPAGNNNNMLALLLNQGNDGNCGAINENASVASLVLDDEEQAPARELKLSFVRGETMDWSDTRTDTAAVDVLFPLAANETVLFTQHPLFQDMQFGDETATAQEPESGLTQLQHSDGPTTLEEKRSNAEPAASFLNHPVHEAMEYVLCNRAYFQAVERCPQVVARETPHDRYLSFFEFNVWEAAQRVANYWKWRVEIFGESKAFLGLRDGGLQQEDYEFLLGGKNALMPPDSCGRSVLFVDRSIVHAPPKAHEMPSRARSFFFLFHSMMEEQWSLSDAGLNKGHAGEFVMVLKTHESRKTPFRSDYKHADFFKRLTNEAMCLTRCCHMHVVACGCDPRSTSRRVLESLFDKVLNALSSFFRTMPHTLHTGNKEQVNLSLQKCGFTSFGLPKSFGGSWSVAREWAQFLLRMDPAPMKEQTVQVRHANGAVKKPKPARTTEGSSLSNLAGQYSFSEKDAVLTLPDSDTDDLALMSMPSLDGTDCLPSDWTSPSPPSETLFQNSSPIQSGQAMMPSVAAHTVFEQHESPPTRNGRATGDHSQESSVTEIRPIQRCTSTGVEAAAPMIAEPPQPLLTVLPDAVAHPALNDPGEGAKDHKKFDSLLSQWAANEDKDIVERVENILEARKAKRRERFNKWRTQKRREKSAVKRRRAKAIRVDTKTSPS